MPFKLTCSRCQQDLLSSGQEIRNIGKRSFSYSNMVRETVPVEYASVEVKEF